MWCRSEQSAKLRVMKVERDKMSDDTSNLILRHLQELRSAISELRNELQSGHRRLKDQLLNQSVQINSLGKPLAELATAVYSKHSEIDELRARVTRIERRLELSDRTRVRCIDGIYACFGDCALRALG